MINLVKCLKPTPRSVQRENRTFGDKGDVVLTDTMLESAAADLVIGALYMRCASYIPSNESSELEYLEVDASEEMLR